MAGDVTPQSSGLAIVDHKQDDRQGTWTSYHSPHETLRGRHGDDLARNAIRHRRCIGSAASSRCRPREPDGRGTAQVSPWRRGLFFPLTRVRPRTELLKLAATSHIWRNGLAAAIVEPIRPCSDVERQAARVVTPARRLRARLNAGDAIDCGEGRVYGGANEHHLIRGPRHERGSVSHQRGLEVRLHRRGSCIGGAVLQGREHHRTYMEHQDTSLRQLLMAVSAMSGAIQTQATAAWVAHSMSNQPVEATSGSVEVTAQQPAPEVVAGQGGRNECADAVTWSLMDGLGLVCLWTLFSS